MQHSKRLMIVALIIAGLQLSACAQKSDPSSKIAPAKVERIEGTDLKRVILTAKAAERLGIKTTPMGDVPVARQRSVGEAVAVVPASTAGAIGMPGQRVDGGPSLPLTPRQVVPYAAVLYDAKGDTWVYTNPNPLTFVRHPIHIDYIEGDLAALSDGPASGTAIVVVGAAELFGAETGIGK
jgi:hypothetical protein